MKYKSLILGSGKPHGGNLKWYRILALAGAVIAASVSSSRAGKPSAAISAFQHSLRAADEARHPVTKTSPRARMNISSSGHLRSFAAPNGYFFPVAKVVPGMPEKTARNFLKENERLFIPANPAVDYISKKTKRIENRHLLHLGQTYAGVPVFGGEAIVEVNNAGGVIYGSVHLSKQLDQLKDDNQATVPRISKSEARRYGIEFVSGGGSDKRLTTTTPRLKLFDPSIFGISGQMHLVWEFRTQSETEMEMAMKLLIDAKKRKIVRAYPLYREACDRRIRDADDGNGIGTMERREDDGPSSIADVNAAYDFVGDAYDFFWREHRRDSIDGDGRNIKVTVRACPRWAEDTGDCPPWRNARWSDWRHRLYIGSQMAVDDVIGHEYTHGVTSCTSGLIYENSPGAIDEGLADVWGEYIDLTNGAGTDTAAVRWIMGEDAPPSQRRNMKTPSQLDYPDHLSSEFYRPPASDPSPRNDFGGVHHNVGIVNKLTYLLTDGDCFRCNCIGGVGISKAADLFYEANVNYLSSAADFNDLGDALERAAEILEWSDEEIWNLRRALEAVGIRER
jgi:bacillolysin